MSQLLRSTSPATGAIVWEGPVADEATIARHLQRSRAVQPQWQTAPLDERVRVARRFAEIVGDRATELAELISDETGKVRWDAATEASAVVNKSAVSIEAAEQQARRYSATAQAGAVRFRPLGVVAVLGPFNFPAHLPNGQIVPALLAGNAVLFKPSEFAPAVGEWMVRQWTAAGLPDGLLAVVQGDRSTGEALVGAEIDGVLFTGSYAGGRSISRALADRPEVLLALEMGGNNPIVVAEVEDLAAAVQTVIVSAYISAGQRCTCARRLIVVDDDRGRAFVEAFNAAVPRISVGLPSQTPEPFYGPLIHENAAAAVLAAQADLVDRGGRALVACRRLSDDAPLLSPGLLDVTTVTDLPDVEIFGPMLQLSMAPDFDTAMEQANCTRYGLAAALLCDRPEHFEDFRQRIRAGVVNWNGPTTGASGRLPFGGLGRSGNHRPAGFSMIDACADPVAVVARPRLAMPTAAPGLSGLRETR